MYINFKEPKKSVEKLQTSYLSFGSTGLLLKSQVISGAGVPSTSHSIVAVSPSGTKISERSLMNFGGVPEILGESKRGEARSSEKQRDL